MLGVNKNEFESILPMFEKILFEKRKQNRGKGRFVAVKRVF
jgi:hypothetical protein